MALRALSAGALTQSPGSESARTRICTASSSQGWIEDSGPHDVAQTEE